jgi:hypothetical protein
LQVFDTQTLSVVAQESVSIAFVSSVVFNSDNTALISVGGDANCHVLELVPQQGGGCVCGQSLMKCRRGGKGYWGFSLTGRLGGFEGGSHQQLDMSGKRG